MAKDSSGPYGPIVVINPNSNEAVTRGLDEALDTFRFPGSPPIECLTLEEGPFGLETQLHSEQVVLPLVRLVEERRDASAVSYTHLTLPTKTVTCRSRWSPYD